MPAPTSMWAEVGLGAVLGRSLGDQLAGYGSATGAIGLAAQVVFAIFRFGGSAGPQTGKIPPLSRPAVLGDLDRQQIAGK